MFKCLPTAVSFFEDRSLTSAARTSTPAAVAARHIAFSPGPALALHLSFLQGGPPLSSAASQIV